MAGVMAILTGLVVALAIVFGGGTRQGFFGDTLIQLAAVPLLIAGLWTLFTRQAEGARRLAVGTCHHCAVLWRRAFPATAVAGGLEGLVWRPARARAGRISDLGAGLATVSISPQATWAALLSVVPPVAIFIAVAQMPNASRRRVALVIVSLGVVSLVLGLLQVAQGRESALRFYSVTNPAEAVGFFANRNHFAALLYTTILIAAPFVVVASRGLSEQTQPGDKNIIRFLWAFLLMASLMVGLIMARSRAGILLGLVALGTVVLLSIFNTGRQGVARDPASRPKMMVRLITSLIVVALVAGTVLALQRAAPRFGLSVADDVRIPILLATLDAARVYMPFGSGLGTFVPAYAALEPTSAIFSAFANRAHNDWAEFALEYGAAGIAIMLAVVIWIVWRGVDIWRGRGPAASVATKTLAQAGWVAIMLVLLHALVEYGLRTSALGAVFAFCCGIIAGQVEADKDPAQKRSRDARTRSSSRSAPADAAARPAWPETADHETSESGWRDSKNWPDEWREDGSDER